MCIILIRNMKSRCPVSFIICLFFLLSQCKALQPSKRDIPPQSVSDGRCLAINFCVWAHRGLVYGFLVDLLQIAIESFTPFPYSVFFIIYVSLWCFIDEIEDSCDDRSYIFYGILFFNKNRKKAKQYLHWKKEIGISSAAEYCDWLKTHGRS